MLENINYILKLSQKGIYFLTILVEFLNDYLALAISLR